jgi:hypothetical protein
MSRERNRNQGDREVIEVSGKSSNDDNDDGDDDNKPVAETNDYKKPEIFQSKSNSEIVTWLISHPEIL